MPRSRRIERLPNRPKALARERALSALSRMRGGMSLRAAARDAFTTPETVRRYLPAAVKRAASGRYVATTSDQYVRTLRFLNARGMDVVTVRGSRTASRIAEYWNAVDHFLKTGSTQRLWKFRGQSFQAGKIKHPFITSPEVLKQFGHQGEVQFEDLYALHA